MTAQPKYHKTLLACYLGFITQAISANFVLLAVLPELLPDPFIGILIAVVIYAMGAGLIEVLISPIVEAAPLKTRTA